VGEEVVMDGIYVLQIVAALNAIAVEIGLLRKQVAKLNEAPTDVVDGNPSHE
jgi:hypothetical protein